MTQMIIILERRYWFTFSCLVIRAVPVVIESITFRHELMSCDHDDDLLQHFILFCYFRWAGIPCSSFIPVIFLSIIQSSDWWSEGISHMTPLYLSITTTGAKLKFDSSWKSFSSWHISNVSKESLTEQNNCVWVMIFLIPVLFRKVKIFHEWVIVWLPKKQDSESERDPGWTGFGLSDIMVFGSLFFYLFIWKDKDFEVGSSGMSQIPSDGERGEKNKS